MLVLSWKEGDEISMPSHGLIVTVLGIEGQRVRVGVSAPSVVAVHRREILGRIAASRQSKESATAALEDPNVDSRSDR